MMGAAEVHPWSCSHRLGLGSGVAAAVVVVGETTGGRNHDGRRAEKMLSCIVCRFRNLRCRAML